jgi:hypothetical protein
MSDVYVIEARERYSGDTTILAIAASFAVARSFVSDLVAQRRDVGLWTQQEVNRWTIELSYMPGNLDIARYTITRWPVVEAVAA